MTCMAENPRHIRRPRLLVRAARFGLAGYVRDRDLRRLFGSAPPPSPGQALQSLIEREAIMESERRTGVARYSIALHVQILTALMAESRLGADPFS